MWCNFEKSVCEDETLSNAFSMRGIFKLKSEEPVLQYPDVRALIQSQKIVLAVDKSLCLLDVDMVADSSFLNFDKAIEVIATSSTGNVIVCGLSDGEVHGIFIKSTPIFNLHIDSKDINENGRTFASIQQIGDIFYLICTNGSIYSFGPLDETPLNVYLNNSTSENESITIDENTISSLTLTRLTVGRKLGNVSDAILIPPNVDNIENNVDLLVLGGSTDLILFRTTIKEHCKICLPINMEGIKRIFNFDNFILILTNDGTLTEFCIFTQTILLPDKKIDYLIDDIVIMECCDENIELLVLTKPQNNERLMKIIEYPSMNCINEFDVQEHSWLVQQPKNAINLYYISGKNVDSGHLPNEIEMQLVSETHPSERFKKLIAKCRFDEAEDFGIQFELSLQPIYEAKAKRLLHELIPISDNNPELLEKNFAKILEIFNKIENNSFFKQIRLFCLPTRKILERFLIEILNHLDAENDENEILEINEQLHRFKTLSLIDPYECNMEWHNFIYHPNLVKMIITLFKSDMLTACLVWKRHACVIINQLDITELKKLIGLIPNNVEPIHLVQWLSQFVATVSYTHPDIMPFITDWSIEKIRNFQFSNNWPEIGLEFSTKIIEIFEEIQFIHSHVCRQHEGNLNRLRELVNALQDLTVLKTSYNLKITLDQYLQETIEDTAIFILKHVHIDNLKNLVTNFLYPIFQENGKCPVEAICQYISIMICSRNSLSTWLDRSIACVELLSNEDKRFESALLILQNCPVPWPETVAPLIKFRNSTHPLAIKINLEYEIQVIKIIQVKYGWEPSGTANTNLKLLMFRIVKMDLPDMINDIHKLTKAAPETATTGYFYCCYEMVRKKKPDVAYELFKYLKNNKIQNGKYANDIISIFAETLEYSVLTDDIAKMEEQKNLIEFLSLITPKENSCQYSRLRVIKQRYDLQHKFKLKVKNIADLNSIENRIQLLQEAAQYLIEQSYNAKIITNFIFMKSKELADALDMQHAFVLRNICQCMQCLPLTCALVYLLLETADCTKNNKNDYICLALEVLVQQINFVKNSKSMKMSTLLYENDPLAYPLIYKLLMEVCLIEENTKIELLEFIKFVHVVYLSYDLNCIENYYNGQEHEINENIRNALKSHCSTEITNGATKKSRVSTSIFDVVEVQTEYQPKKSKVNNQMSIVEFVSHTFVLMVVVCEPKNCFFEQLKNMLPANIQTDDDTDFFRLFEYLTKAKIHDVWYLIAQYLLEYQKKCTRKIINEKLISLQLTRVFKSQLSLNDVNIRDLFVMLISDENHQIILNNLENEVKTDQQKYNLLILLEMYCRHFKKTDQFEALKLKRLKHSYYMEFVKQDPSLKGKFNADLDNIEQLLKQCHNKKLDVKLLERMSIDFDLDYQKLLITQIISVLSAQEPQYEIKFNAFGEEELVMIDCVENIRNFCKPYVDEIKNMDLFCSKLKQFIKQINIYFYELYLVVIELLQCVDDIPEEMKVWTNILHFLKHKMINQRRNGPSQLETDIWLQSQTEITVLPKIAYYRLPFKPIVEKPLKEILDNELNIDDCESWFPLIEMHTLLKGSKDLIKNRDYFCMSAVKNSIAEHKPKSDSKIWHLQPTDNAFLQSILRLAKHVHNPCKAFSILYFASNYAPKGADQVEAAHECYKYAMEHFDEINNTKYQEQLLKIQRKYPVLKTQHMLYTFGLNDEEFLCLVDNPTELINSLYHHELILKTRKVDINAVAEKISELHNLDIESIQYQLLQKWLSFSIDSPDGTIFEETLFEDALSASQDIKAKDAVQNVFRAKYILNGWPKKKAMQFLIGNIFPVNDRVNLSKQLQMYECFAKLNDGSESFNDMLTQKEYITIKCVHHLKLLGYNTTKEKFDQSNKVDILKTLWQRFDPNNAVSTLELMANICIGFDIYLPKIWNGILKRMKLSNMIRELNAVVDVLSCKQQLLSTEGLISAWDFVLKHPFKLASQSRNVKQEEILHKTLFRLQNCPVLHKLDIFSFAELCIHLKLTYMAAVMIVLCKNEQEQIKTKNLVSSRLDAKDKIRQEILDLEDAGIHAAILNFTLKELCL